jgi:uncharacterized membrane protein
MTPRPRVASVDILRGAVMVLMAIDHVRVFSGVPAGGPDPAVFLTRWVTHFCAPGFVFLAGTAAFLRERRAGGRGPLARFLLWRGAWLVLLELTLLRLAWTFNLDYRHYVLAGVIWAIGWCLVLMAGLVWLPLRAVAAVGAVLVAGHNLLDPVLPRLVPAAEASPVPWLWRVLYLGPIAPGNHEGPFVVLYSLVPWIGVMALGYAFGAVVGMDPPRRRRLCLGIGLGAVAAFVALRATGVYGDPHPWTGGGPGFINTTKYPASLQFLLMTLGPLVALVPALEGARGRLARALETFGRVPLFYYVLHIPLIHAAACLVSLLRLGRVDPWLFENHPMMVPPAPPGYAWGLPLLYLVTALVVGVLYLACRRYQELKARGGHAWLRLL